MFVIENYMHIEHRHTKCIEQHMDRDIYIYDQRERELGVGGILRDASLFLWHENCTVAGKRNPK